MTRLTLVSHALCPDVQRAALAERPSARAAVRADCLDGLRAFMVRRGAHLLTRERAS